MNANVSIYQDSVKDSSGILTSESNEMGLSTIFNYNGNNVAFIKTSYGILINATDMARPYNKRPVDYLRQIYVNELVSTIVSQTHISEDQLVIKMRGSSENGGGTWLYEDVAIDFAQWLDVKFKVWCNSKIKELLTTGLVKLPNFNNPPEAARAWADEYEARMKAEKEVRLALEAKEKIEKEKRMVQAELNTAIDTIKENEPVIDMFKRSIPREGVLIRESSTPLGTLISLRLPWNISLPYSSMITPNEGFMILVDIHIGWSVSNLITATFFSFIAFFRAI